MGAAGHAKDPVDDPAARLLPCMTAVYVQQPVGLESLDFASADIMTTRETWLAMVISYRKVNTDTDSM